MIADTSGLFGTTGVDLKVSVQQNPPYVGCSVFGSKMVVTWRWAACMTIGLALLRATAAAEQREPVQVADWLQIVTDFMVSGTPPCFNWHIAI